jgi:hypothetical protein
MELRTVYGSCNPYVVFMELLHDTKTNESRTVSNPQYARYRADKLKVTKIEHKYDMTLCVDVKDPKYRFNNIEYVVGDTMIVDDYDENPDNIYSKGICYFKTYEGALMHRTMAPNRYYGKWSVYSDDGDIMIKASFNGKNFVRSIRLFHSFELPYDDLRIIEYFKKIKGIYPQKNLHLMTDGCPEFNYVSHLIRVTERDVAGSNQFSSTSEDGDSDIFHVFKGTRYVKADFSGTSDDDATSLASNGNTNTNTNTNPDNGVDADRFVTTYRAHYN